MRRLVLGMVVALALVLAAPGTTAPAAPTATVTVQIKKTGFSPANVTINAEDSVTWKNVDTVNHQVVANGGQFASPILKPGATYTFTFKKAGTYHYHDALVTTLKGTINVTGPPPSISFVLSQPIVTYGTSITLTAQVSSHKAGETVTITQQPIDQPSPIQLAVVTTGANGIASYMTTPQIYTTYTATWKGLTSLQLLAQVAPKITLPGPSRGYFHTYVLAAKSFAGHWVYLQRLNQFGEWVSIKKLVLGSKSGRIFPTTAYLPRGTAVIRIFMTVNQAGLGYLSAHSGTQRVIRR